MKLSSKLRRRKISMRTGGYSYLITDIAKIYNFPPGDGTGQTIGIIELGGAFVQSDVNSYCALCGASFAPTITPVMVNGATQSGPGDDATGEVSLDACIIGAGLPKATIRVYFAPNTSADFVAAITQARKDGCNVISISWGGPENTWAASDRAAMETELAACAAAGINVFVAAGDNGSSDGESGKNVDYPGSSPNAISCGGTSLIAANGVRKTETVWNDGSQGGATGGGISAYFPVPSWQKAVAASPGTLRCVPDVAGVADPETGWTIFVEGVQQVIGGTSAVAPLMAVLCARLNQALGKNIGNFNPVLYGLSPAPTFDVVTGNNGTYAAKVGYDCCTGLGVPNGMAFLAALQGTAPTPPPVTTPTQPTPPAATAVTLNLQGITEIVPGQAYDVSSVGSEARSLGSIGGILGGLQGILGANPGLSLTEILTIVTALENAVAAPTATNILNVVNDVLALLGKPTLPALPPMDASPPFVLAEPRSAA